jgi:hypothetical protein
MSMLSDEQRAVLARPTWQPDDDAPFCHKCEEVFGFFVRRHHCRACGLIFCSACTQNQLEMPIQYGYAGPQRVCEDCLFKVLTEQETQRITKNELITIQFYLRDSEIYRTRNREIYNMGTRNSNEKTPALVEFKDTVTGTKTDHILTLINSKDAPVPITGNTKKIWENLLYQLEHPFVFPILEANTMNDKDRAIIFRPSSTKGSLKDLIYNQKDPFNSAVNKYKPRILVDKFDEVLGLPQSIRKLKCLSPLSLDVIRMCGRQILEALLYFQHSRFPYPHLHPGNVIFYVCLIFFFFFLISKFYIFLSFFLFIILMNFLSFYVFISTFFTI